MKVNIIILIIAILTVPLTIGLGFGYLSLLHADKILKQFDADTKGIPTSAEIISLEIDEIRHHSSKQGDQLHHSKYSYFCNIQVKFNFNNEKQLSDIIRLEENEICHSYSTGDNIKGKIIQREKAIIVLDEGRLHPYWFLISFSLFLFFTVAPLIFIANRLLKHCSSNCNPPEK